MKFVLVNESSSAPLSPQITAPWLEEVAAGIDVYLNRDVGPEWGNLSDVRAGSSAADVQTGETVVALVDALPDAPDAVAYHSVDGAAAPFVLVGVGMCATLDDLTVAISHELAEAEGDPECNAWRDDGVGDEYAQELCDTVQARSYALDDDHGIRVSDFVLSSFFAPNARGPYTHMARSGIAPDVPTPFATAPGGYQIKRTSGGGETQVFGDLGIRTARAKHWASRTYRRGVRT